MKIKVRLLLYEYWFGPIVGIIIKTRRHKLCIEIRIPEWLASCMVRTK